MKFLIENLGINNSDTFPGYGLGLGTYADCVYGIGDTAKEALDDAIEMLSQSIDLTAAMEKQIREDFGPYDETVAEELGLSEEQDDSGIGTYFHVGIKWRA
jgi:hypothetical protein